MQDQAAVFDSVVKQRRSLRAFLPEPIDQEILDTVFRVAARAPSNCNTQPWLVHVASGDKIAALREQLPALFMAGATSLDFPYDGAYSGVYRERQYGSAQALYAAVGIDRADKARRQQQFMRNFSFFDAPHVAFFFLPEPFGLREAADLGMYAQTVMLALTAHGLGSCPQTALGFLADAVRDSLGVEPENKLLFGLSFGYPDPNAPANRCATDRASVEETVVFHR